MRRSLKHDILLSALTGIIAINTVVGVALHRPAAKSIYDQRIYEPTECVQPINMSDSHVETIGFFKRIQDQTVLIECYDVKGKLVSTGSGVILDVKRGIIMTANHVVSPAVIDRIKIRTTTGYLYESSFVDVLVRDAGILEGLHDFIFPPKTPQLDPLDMEEKLRDEKRESEQEKHEEHRDEKKKSTYGPDMKHFYMQDITSIKLGYGIKGTQARFATVEPKIGDPIYVVGSPYGPDFFNTVSKGILSGINRTHHRLRGSLRVYQTDAAILPGNSGGPWFNSAGEIVAISTSWVPSSGTVGFGIPLPELKRIMKKV